MCQSSANMEPEEKSFVECNEQNVSETNVDHDGGSPAIPALSDSDVIPQSEKRKRRQWAAWTREEEECFFTALRQVGKNFEKITSRVQSKNKDQVRHYYYRLVRRMNKLLGPGFCLDAKNSKDTNAAMLRWWSVLEKYSCKVSKLHLKPRRFKIFVETLEHQLLKDKKKNVKKQLSQGEKCSFPTSTFPNQNKSSVNDSRPIKIVPVDGQNVEKSGNGKGSSTRRSLNLGITKSNSKGDSSTKLTKQRRKTGVVSTAAIKRWEKAAMAGVSLVADAAEHVERTSKEERANFLDGLSVLSAQAVGCSMEHNDPGCSGQVQANLLTKLKLQLFPIDDNTRKALEMDNHNPHLELTLSARKKITSVLEHMARKWGSSSVASGELVLFPYNIQRENISAYQRWSRDSIATATEVFAMIGSPPIFRMRYGWMVAGELQSAIPEAPVALSINSLVENTIAKETPSDPTIVQVEKKDEMGKHVYSSGGQPTEENSTTAAIKANPVSNIEDNCLDSPNLPSVSKRNKSTSGKIKKVDHRLKKTLKLSAGEWADSLTDVSAEDLIPEDNAVANCVESLETPFQSSHCLDAVSFTCDSFDAAIAAHISSQYKSISKPSLHLSSIWDAEETCDEFTFQKNALARKRDQNELVASSSLAGNGKATSSSASFDLYQVLPEETVAEDVNEEDQMDESPSEPYEIENPSKDFGNLTDIYWPESLGPLELDVPSCKYYSEDLILSDSLSGLNRFIIANSLDTFQHCPLFGFDDKGLSPAAGAQRGASFAGKIGTGDSAGVRSLQV